MNMMRNALIAVAACTVLLPAAAADWSDNEVSLLAGNRFHDNGNDIDIGKTTLTLQHASGYKFGRNFFFADLVKSDGADNRHGEVYAEYYHTLSLTRVTGRDWSKNTLKDIGLTTGINYGAKNSAFGPNPKVLLAGPSFDFNVPGFAFFNVDLLAYHDMGTFSGFGGGKLCGKSATAYQLTPAWLMPFSVGGAKFAFTGFVDLIGKHGSCAQQILAQPQLRWDVGHHMGKSDSVYLGVEWQYWHNKFGIDGRKESFPQLMLTWKL